MKNFFSYILIILLFGCDKAADTAAYSVTGQGGSLARFTVVGNYLYAVDRQNLKVFDITDPSKPLLKKTIPAGFEIETIFPFKDKLFLGSTSVIYVFSIDDPANPQKLSEAVSPAVMRRCDPVVAKDDVAYATLRTNGPCGGTMSVLAVFDIKDASKPVQRKQIQVGEPYGLGYWGNALYVCDRYYGFTVFDITNPFDPVMIKHVGNNNAAYFMDVVPYNNVLVCWTSKGIMLYDISSAFNPNPIKQID